MIEKEEEVNTIKIEFRNLYFVSISFFSILLIKMLMITLSLSTIAISQNEFKFSHLTICHIGILTFILSLLIYLFFRDFTKQTTLLKPDDKTQLKFTYYISGPVLMFVSGFFFLNRHEMNRDFQKMDLASLNIIVLSLSIYNIFIFSLDSFVKKLEKIKLLRMGWTDSISKILK